MKNIIIQMRTTPVIICLLIAIVQITAGCRKEKKLEPGNLDENYFFVKDNPDDPVDHAIYQFYESTGIAGFYNDTLHKQRIPDSSGIARYSYIKLSLSYSPTGERDVVYKAITSKNRIPALLDLLKNDMVSKLPKEQLIPSILMIDSFWYVSYKLLNPEISHGWTSFHGFNTLGVVVKDVETMNVSERKMYVASILAGIAEKRINNFYKAIVNERFNSISTNAGKVLSPGSFYLGTPFILFLPANQVPPPQNLGFIRYINTGMLNIPIPLYQLAAPREEDDIRAYLTAAFYYPSQEFREMHINDALVLQKFNVIRELAKEAGFVLPE